jgi:O-antigen ligase
MSPKGIGFLIALLTAGMLWPIEAAVDGAGLQWAALWCLAGSCIAAAAVIRLRLEDNPVPGTPDETRTVRRPIHVSEIGGTFRLHLADVGVILLVVGQWISTVFVFIRPGDRRAALNLSLEWLGLLVAWFLLRSLLKNSISQLQWTTAIISLAAGIAVYSVYQREYVRHDQGQWYQTRRDELDALQKRTDSAAVMRTGAILREFQQNGVPLDGAGRILWEQRLLSSSEPTGPFALANTLSGILAMALVLLAGNLLSGLLAGQTFPWWRTLTATVVFGLLTWCLILTKSRTAWAGSCVGLLWMAGARWRVALTRRVQRMLVAGGILTAVALAAAAGSGALDKEVILDAPRSLQFRLFYWLGTIDFLRDHPWVGPGPGNFRQAYLQYKYPEASEEIRDPHNALLEAWTSGGLISLCGILICVVVLLRSMQRSAASTAVRTAFSTSGSLKTTKSRAKSSVGVWIVSGFLLHSSWNWLNGSDLFSDESRQMLIPLMAAIVAAIRPMFPVPPSPPELQAAILAGGIHLMGAGGFQMSTMMLLILSFLAIVVGEEQTGRMVTENDHTKNSQLRRISPAGPASNVRGVWASAAACGAAGLAIVYLGLIPVMTCQQLTNAGKHAASTGSGRSAETFLRQAISADPLSINPRQQLAEFLTYRLMEVIEKRGPAPASPNSPPTGDLSGEGEFQGRLRAAIAACDDLAAADVTNVGAIRYRGNCFRAIFDATGDSQMLKAAIQDQQRVVQLHPCNAEDWWRLAQSASYLKDSEGSEITKTAAKKALEFESVNRSWGHRDRYLTEKQLEFLKSL